MVNHLVYDAFGKVTSESDPAMDSVLLFTARPFDADTGLQNNLNRWCDPAVGRWVSEDPMGFAGGDENLYRYVGNGVLTAVDPSGLEKFYVCGKRVQPGPGIGRCIANECGWLHVSIYGDESGVVYEGWGGGQKPPPGGGTVPTGPEWKCWPLRRADTTVIVIPSPVPILPIVQEKKYPGGLQRASRAGMLRMPMYVPA